MSSLIEEIQQRLDTASDALQKALAAIEQARTAHPDQALQQLDEADRHVAEAERIVDVVHLDATTRHGPNHMAYQFGQTALALVRAKEGVQSMREEILRHRPP